MTLERWRAIHQTLTVDLCVHFNLAAGTSIEVQGGSECETHLRVDELGDRIKLSSIIS